MLSTTASCHLLSIQQLPGGTAEDYSKHILDTVDALASIYSSDSSNKITFDECKSDIITKIKGCSSDRAVINGPIISLLENAWDKDFSESKYYSNPIDRISAELCTQIVVSEDTEARNMLEGTECLAWKIILLMYDLCFSESKGNVKEFQKFLVQERLKKTIIPKNIRNRLNTMFHRSSIYYIHYDTFCKFLEGFQNPDALEKKLAKAFAQPVALMQFNVFGLIGRLFSGPWMSTFYISFNDQPSLQDGIKIATVVINEFEEQLKNPELILYRTHDFLGNLLDSDKDLKQLMKPPQDLPLFTSMVEVCLGSIFSVLKLQYMQQLEDLLKIKATGLTPSGWQNTMDVESVIGEYCGMVNSNPNMNVLTISNLIKAKMNGIAQFLLECNEDRLRSLVKLSNHHSRKLK